MKGAAGAGLILVLEPQGPPGWSPGPPTCLQPEPHTHGEMHWCVSRQHPLITHLHCPWLPGSPLWGGAPPRQPAKVWGWQCFPGATAAPHSSQHSSHGVELRGDISVMECGVLVTQKSVCSSGHSGPSIGRVFRELRKSGDAPGVQWEAETGVGVGAAAGRPSQDPRGWHLHPCLWVRSCTLGPVGGHRSVGASGVGPRAGLLCRLTLMVTRV